jgi:hypothetical protein
LTGTTTCARILNEQLGYLVAQQEQWLANARLLLRNLHLVFPDLQQA